MAPTRPRSAGYGPAYRYPQAGWIVLHIEGEPYDRGYQHGRLMAPEIADYIKTLATRRSPRAPRRPGKADRTLVDALFLRRYDQEYLEEMKGTADGAAAAGATFEGRPLDLLDVVAINSEIEVGFLDAALEASAHGLEGKIFREPDGRQAQGPQGRPLLGLRRHRPGHGRRPDRLRPHHDVEPVHARDSSTSGSTSSRRRGTGS